MIKMGLKHNCTKVGDFEFVEVAIDETTKDKIKCKVCGRIWIEEKS